jgi:alkyl hydroperoxide reductase subunit AhpC
VFYPADFTFVCPTELGDLADHYDTFKALGVRDLRRVDRHALHAQGLARHVGHDRQDPYPMIGDPTGTITRNFDVMIEEEGLALRGTFVINPEGQIKLCEITTTASAATPRNCCARCRLPSTSPAHPGEVCPAKWTPGAETLAPSLDLVGKI